MKVLVRPRVEVHTSFALFYERINAPGSGYSFNCTEQGEILPSELNPCSRQSLRYCQRSDEFHPPRVQTFNNRVRESGILECSCGAHHHFGWGDSTCDNCGAHYNAAGQQLAHRYPSWVDTEEQAEAWLCSQEEA